jgi:hypothetical protein
VHRRRFDLSAAVAAVLFLGLAAVHLADGLGRTRMWAVAAVLAGLGLVGIAHARRRDG